jgi:hypothetical protein
VKSHKKSAPKRYHAYQHVCRKTHMVRHISQKQREDEVRPVIVYTHKTDRYNVAAPTNELRNSNAEEHVILVNHQGSLRATNGIEQEQRGYEKKVQTSIMKITVDGLGCWRNHHHHPIASRMQQSALTYGWWQKPVSHDSRRP